MPFVQLVAVAAALVAAGLHAWFFLLESVWFRRPSVWARFGIRSQADAEIARSFAYNQGFYNLFLAVGAAWGGLKTLAYDAAGVPIMLFSCACMVAAGVVLVTHNPRLWRAALIQMAPPLVAIVVQVLLDAGRP
jgi:putative membrane protein